MTARLALAQVGQGIVRGSRNRMATNQIRVYNTLGEALAAATPEFMSRLREYLDGLWTSLTAAPVDIGGYQGIAFESISGGDDYNVCFVALELTSVAILPIATLAREPGFNIQIGAVDGGYFGEPDYDLDALVTAYDDIWNTAIKMGIEAWTEGVVGDEMSATTTIDLLNSSAWTWAWFISGPSGIVVQTSSVIAGKPGIPWDPENQYGNSAAPVMAGTQTLGVVAVDTGGIVEAINEISNQDVEASFNQGQTAYSIKAKVTAGP